MYEIITKNLAAKLKINEKYITNVLNLLEEGNTIAFIARYRKEETKNEEGYSKELASLAEIFVNDAFGTAHRAHCSTVGAGQFLEERVCGYLIQKELDFLGSAVENPVRPFLAILGLSLIHI